ncbi:molybdate ABC transporter substrate-binding protein [Tropicimonas marinistellae]|uniref:molybdate ABC transporter substrate-binding protein n=1 Tax=Tropicimonas marinistellae TaxID=1739787 RepID=UPI00082E7D46|nr:molybdate ABC transporter substrate-binding protein [Tropicimonas marinistellae]
MFQDLFGKVRAGAVLVAAFALSAGGAVAADPLIFAAASTRAALDTALAECGQSAVVSYGASGSIARQISEGAPADLFLSANPKWMHYMVDAGLVAPGDVTVLISNRLSLIAPTGEGPVDLDGESLDARLSSAFFAVADPSIAPVGQYGRDALVSLGLWRVIEPVLLPTRNTISTVAAVSRGEAALGLVYRSDASGIAGVEIAAEIPADTHAPIHYLIAPVGQGGEPDAAERVLACLTGENGQRIFESFGFEAIDGEAAE